MWCDTALSLAWLLSVKAYNYLKITFFFPPSHFIHDFDISGWRASSFTWVLGKQIFVPLYNDCIILVFNIHTLDCSWIVKVTSRKNCLTHCQPRRHFVLQSWSPVFKSFASEIPFSRLWSVIFIFCFDRQVPARFSGLGELTGSQVLWTYKLLLPEWVPDHSLIALLSPAHHRANFLHLVRYLHSIFSIPEYHHT